MHGGAGISCAAKAIMMTVRPTPAGQGTCRDARGEQLRRQVLRVEEEASSIPGSDPSVDDHSDRARR